ncbi:TolC family protein [Flavobacterium ardleyense]|uniref:TolC family protein n=1 Tax=Flavobacterium ardleyense TaxID=2038737 RepID=UPI00298BE024|nr:TolC family protein [Flavobacterium ardleyense]
MTNKLLLLSIALLSMQQILSAQTVQPIAKSEVMSRFAKNASVNIAVQEFKQAKAEYRQTNAVFLPTVTASHTAFSTTNPLMAFGSKLNQEILTANDFNPDLLNNPQHIENFVTKIDVQQPILNFDGMLKRKAAKSKLQSMELQKQRTAEHLTLDVEKAYMQLQLAYKLLDVLDKAQKTANANLKLAENSFKQGFLQKADVLNVQVRVAEVNNQIQSAKSNVQNASDYLAFLMNDSQDDLVYLPTDSLTVNSFQGNSEVAINENRSDIKAMQLASTAFEFMNKADKMSFLPRLNAFGSYELYDDKIFTGSANGYLFGAQLSWDLFQGSKRIGQLQKSSAESERSKLQYDQYVSQSNLELKRAKRMLTDAENKLNLTKLSIEQSGESLRLRSNRYREGLEKTSDLLLSETQYAQKQLEYYQTVFEYNYALAYLQFLTK